jgi:hypothetical protein
MSAVTEKVNEVNEIKTETVKSHSDSDSDSEEDEKVSLKKAKKVKKELSEAKKLQLGNARKARALKARQKALEEKSKLENIEVQIDSIEKKSSAPPKVPVEETSSFDYYALLIPVIGFGSLLLTKYLEKKSENLKKVEVLAVEEVAAAPQALNFFS